MRNERRLAIFDLDGTLVNAYPAITASFNYTMERLGLRRHSPLVIRRAVGYGDRNLLKPFVPGESLTKALTIYRRHHSRALREKTRLLPGARRLLIFLRARGYLCAIATNRPKRFSWIIIRHLKVRPLFDYVLCGDELARMKPHPEVLRRVMRALHVGAARTYFIGDMPLDARTARRAGVTSIMITTGSSTARELADEKPDYLIARLTELKEIL